MTTTIAPYHVSIPSRSEDKLFAIAIAVWADRQPGWVKTTITDLAIQEARETAAREKLIRDTFAERADTWPLGLLLSDDHLYEAPQAVASVLRADLMAQIAKFLCDLSARDLLNRSSDVESVFRVLMDLSEAFGAHHSRQMLETAGAVELKP